MAFHVWISLNATDVRKVALEKQREKERSIALLKKKEQEVRLDPFLSQDRLWLKMIGTSKSSYYQ